MDIDALSLFIKAAALGNITAAGKELGLLPSVASQKLMKLENTLGLRLLSRTTRHISLTEDGRAFMPYAKNILAAIDEAYFSTTSANSNVRRTLKISAPGSFARICLIPLIADFLKIHRNLKINLILSDSLQDLNEIGIDVAIRIAELKDSTWVARNIAADYRILCASPAYLLSHGEPLTPIELEQHQCILFGEQDQWHFKCPKGAQQPALEAIFRTNCGESVRLAAEQGLGIASISTWNAKASLQNGALVRIMQDFELQQRRNIWAIYPSAKLISSKARLFVEFLTNELKDPQARDYCTPPQR